MTYAFATINEAERLDALGRYMSSNTSADKRFDDIARLAAQICSAPMSAISLVGSETVWVKSHYGFSIKQLPRSDPFSTHVINDRQTVLVVPDTLDEPHFSDHPLVTGDPRVRFFAGAPITTPDHHVIGALTVMDTTPRSLSVTEISALETLSQQVLALFDLDAKDSQLRIVKDNVFKLGTVDSLTALHNHRAFQEAIRTEFARACIRRQSMGLVFIDIDGFKHYNDRFGYASGDLVMRALSEILRRNVRLGDFVARYAGGAFALILPNTRSKETVDIADALRSKIADHAWAHGPVRVSCGLTTSNAATPDVDQLIAEADLALFSAKQKGGNIVRHATAIDYVAPAMAA